MSMRFAVNFATLLAGAGVVVCGFAFSLTTLGWVALGAGALAIVAALTSFATAHQGVYQRIADVVICGVGAWAIVAGQVMPDGHRWLEVSAGLGLAGLGALGLLVRELGLAGGLTVGQARIGPDQFAQLAALQRDAGVRQ